MSFITNMSDNKPFKKHIIPTLSQNNIYIMENFLDIKDFKTLQSYITDILSGADDKLSNIKYGHSSIGWHPYYTPHWSYFLTDVEFFNTYLMEKIRNIDTWTHDLKIKRIYVSFQTSGQTGQWHFDDAETGSYTFTLYCNIHTTIARYREHKPTIEVYDNNTIDDKSKNIFKKSTDYDDDGYFMIKDQNTQPIYLKTHDNHGALFNSNILHNGGCPRYDSTSARAVIAFKLFKPPN
jgi:hypothetical protein